MSLHRGSRWGGGGCDTALQKICELHERPDRPYQWSFLTVMLPNQFLTSIFNLLEVFSQLATCQLAPGPFKEYLCACGRQTGHRNKPWGKQTEEEWTLKWPSIVSLSPMAYGWTNRLMNLLDMCIQADFCHQYDSLK